MINNALVMRKYHAWNKGLTKETDERVNSYAKKLSLRIHSLAHCINISKSKKGKPNLKRRTPLIEILCLNCNKVFYVKYKNRKRRFCSHACHISMRNCLLWKDPVYREKMCAIISERHWDSAGIKNPNWKGGISSEPYSFEFNNTLKKEVRKNNCTICGMSNEESLNKTGDSLYVHHIDYNKKNSDMNNLVALCVSCHSKTNFNREYWKKYFAV
jgi:hypothetical protein